MSLLKSCLFLLVPAVVLAQSYTASLRGIVTDTSGAAIPGARVIATSVQRGTEFLGSTDGQGRYALTALPPGDYTLAAEAAGFKKLVRSAFNLQVQQQATIDLKMDVGEVSTVVEVEASAPLLNTTIANL